MPLEAEPVLFYEWIWPALLFFFQVAAILGDNQVGIDIILNRSNVPAVNAMSAGAELGDLLQSVVGLGNKAKERSA
jgi:hypothetical protein